MKTNSYFMLFIRGPKKIHLNLVTENCSQCFVTKHTIYQQVVIIKIKNVKKNNTEDMGFLSGTLNFVVIE